jgi:hypothetical protein
MRMATFERGLQASVLKLLAVERAQPQPELPTPLYGSSSGLHPQRGGLHTPSILRPATALGHMLMPGIVHVCLNEGYSGKCLRRTEVKTISHVSPGAHCIMAWKAILAPRNLGVTETAWSTEGQQAQVDLKGSAPFRAAVCPQPATRVVRPTMRADLPCSYSSDMEVDCTQQP